MSRSKHKISSDVAGTAKKCQVIMMETKVKIMERVKGGKNMLSMYYLCEKYYKPITVQYYTANCVTWVPRLALLDL